MELVNAASVVGQPFSVIPALRLQVHIMGVELRFLCLHGQVLYQLSDPTGPYLVNDHHHIRTPSPLSAIFHLSIHLRLYVYHPLLQGLGKPLYMFHAFTEGSNLLQDLWSCGKSLEIRNFLLESHVLDDRLQACPD